MKHFLKMFVLLQFECFDECVCFVEIQYNREWILTSIFLNMVEKKLIESFYGYLNSRVSMCMKFIESCMKEFKW